MTLRGDVMSKGHIFFIGFNMLIIIFCLVVSFVLHSRANGYFAHDVVYAAPRLNESHLHFSIADVDRLERALPLGAVIVTERRGSVFIEASMQSAVTRVIFTEASYFTVHALDFIEGWHWYGSGGNDIVLNHTLAWRLFGSIENITGMPIWIEERVYTITGIVEQQNENRYMAWMPVDSGPAILPITTMYVLPPEPNPLTAYITRDEIMFGRRLRDYSVVDINRFVESMNIRNRILLYTIWVLILIFLVRFIWRRIESNGIKAFKSLKWMALPLIGVPLCVYVLWGINDILMWLPNLSNPHTSVFESISTVGMLPPEGYLPYGLLQLSRLSRYVNIMFVAGLVGLFNLLFSLGFGRSVGE